MSEEPGRVARLGRAMKRVRVVDFHDFLGDVDPEATPPDSGDAAR